MNCHQCRQNCPSQKPRRQRGWFNWRKKPQHQEESHQQALNIALVGNPNVGKSVLFNLLTGRYVTVSNYPGTTVEVSTGQTTFADRPANIVDTPGMYSLLPITEEEKVARDLLFSHPFNLVIHVIDAKHLARMLPLTFQLIEAGLPLLLVLNMMDEAKQLNLEINRETLERKLGIPVVTMAAALKMGYRDLQIKVAEYVDSRTLSPTY